MKTGYVGSCVLSTDHLTGVFVLNTDQHKWLTGPNMNLKPEKVRLTAHWVDSVFAPS